MSQLRLRTKPLVLLKRMLREPIDTWWSTDVDNCRSSACWSTSRTSMARSVALD